ncbi:MAG: GAF domain-containing protein [Ardenticatenaceae bacterium]|nr:GAF domain-containing protein [Ardenticatenaceae bacterium]
MVANESLHRNVRTLRAIAEALNGALAPEEMLEAALKALVDELGYRAAAVRLLNPETGELQLVAASHLSQEYLEKGPVKLAESPIDQRVLAGETVAVATLGEDIFQYPGAAEREGLRSVLAVPLRLRGRPLGVLRVYRSEARSFDAEAEVFLEAVGDLIARALANAQLYQTFRQLAHAVNSSLEVDSVLQRLLDGIVRELQVKAASVRLLGPRRQRLHLVAATGLSQQYLKKGEIRIEQSSVDQQVLATKTPVTLYDVQTEPGFQYPAEAAREGIRSVLVVPMTLHDEPVGVLRAYSAQPHRFTAEEMALIIAVADMGAIALENARLHEQLNEKYQQSRSDWSGWFRFLAFS